jgi:hypothetical protein
MPKKNRDGFQRLSRRHRTKLLPNAREAALEEVQLADAQVRVVAEFVRRDDFAQFGVLCPEHIDSFV